MPQPQVRDRNSIAARAARDIPEGWYVNLGIGIPTLIPDHIPEDREVIFQSENGILGMGPTPAPEDTDPWLVNAGKQNVTLRPGASLFHHADSFAMIRGGHLDLCVLGAFEVARSGDLANWSTSSSDSTPAVGGAMDLAVGARQIWVLMEHTSKDNKAKLVERCSYPITAAGIVSRIYTNLAVIDVTSDGFEVIEMVPGMTQARLQQLTAADLKFSVE
jgi:3-oxoadipate CoA-transferase beta subunit